MPGVDVLVPALQRPEAELRGTEGDLLARVASAREAVGGRDDGGRDDGDPGGVVRASDQVVDIVPEHHELVIEARVSLQDIDTVHAGQEAYVMFPSFPQRSMHRIAGDVVHVSADAFHDERPLLEYLA
jgi:HlyD family secretion protein